MGTCITTDTETPLYYHSAELAEINRIYFLEGQGGNVFRKLFLVWESECVRSMRQARETSFLPEEKEGDKLLLAAGKLEILKNDGESGTDTGAPEK